MIKLHIMFYRRASFRVALVQRVVCVECKWQYHITKAFFMPNTLTMFGQGHCGIYLMVLQHLPKWTDIPAVCTFFVINLRSPSPIVHNMAARWMHEIGWKCDRRGNTLWFCKTIQNDTISTSLETLWPSVQTQGQLSWQTFQDICHYYNYAYHCLTHQRFLWKNE